MQWRFERQEKDSRAPTGLAGHPRSSWFEKAGAQKRTRTSTPLRAPAPEAGASTNSAIWARGRPRELGAGAGLVNESGSRGPALKSPGRSGKEAAHFGKGER